MLRVETAGFDDLFDLGNGYPTRLGTGSIKIIGSLAKHQVSGLVSLPCLDDGKIGGQAGFKDIALTAKFTRLFTLSQGSTETGAGEESRDSGTSGTKFLRQSPLRSQLKLQVAIKELLFEDRIFANVGRDHLLNLAGLQQQSETELVNTSVVTDNSQLFGSAVTKGGN